jgi:hypothetical protein
MIIALLVILLLAASVPVAANPADVDTLLLLEDLAEAQAQSDPDFLETLHDRLLPVFRDGRRRSRLISHIDEGATRLSLLAQGPHYAISCYRRRKGTELKESMSLAVHAYHSRLACGSLSVQQGLGLLVAAAGRRNTLSTAAPLALGGFKWRPRWGAPVDRGLIGTALGIDTPMLDVMAAQARLQDDRSTSLRLFSAGFGGERIDLRALFVSMPGERGASVGFRVGDRRRGLMVETAASRDADLGWLPMNAGLALRSEIGKARLSAQFVSTSGNHAPLLAARPAVLHAWGGKGWALRASMNLTSDLKLNLLCSGYEDPAAPEADYRGGDGGRLEASLTRSLSPSLVMSARLKRQRETRHGWSDQSAWLPAQWQSERLKYQLAGRLEHRSASRRLILACRVLETVKGDLEQGYRTNDRSLISMSIRQWLRDEWRLSCSVDQAWGGTADLYSVDVPVQGIMTPLHWGHWDEGVSIGIEYSRRYLRIGLASMLRSAESDEGIVQQKTVDLRMGIYW